MKLSIVIPAYNEEKNIAGTVEDYARFFRKWNMDFEIIVVPNNCSDNTVNVVEGLKGKYREVKDKVINEEVGKGGAIIEGIKEATGGLISYVDADNSAKADQVFFLINNLKDYDCAMGSRWMRGSIILNKQPFMRRVASRGFNFLVRKILGMQFQDTQCGGKVFKREALMSVVSDLKIKDWAFDVGILHLLMKKGFRVNEVPIVWGHSGDSNLKMHKAIPGMFFSLLKLRFGK